MMGRRLLLADTVTGGVILVSGILITLGAWNMPRFEERSINPWTVPGIMPGFVGAVLSILGLLLLIRGGRNVLASRARAEGRAGATPVPAPALAVTGPRAIAVCLGLGLLFVATVGSAPLIPVTFLFLFSFMAAFEMPAILKSGRRLARLLTIAVYAAVASIAIPILFRDVFLVRLP